MPGYWAKVDNRGGIYGFVVSQGHGVKLRSLYRTVDQQG